MQCELLDLAKLSDFGKEKRPKSLGCGVFAVICVERNNRIFETCSRRLKKLWKIGYGQLYGLCFWGV